jgi:hypothetical protein
MPRKQPKPTSELPAAHEMVIALLKIVGGYSKTSNCQCTGNCSVERPNKPPTVIMYATFPNGDYLTWFNDGTHFNLYSLVNENLKHIFKCPPDQLPKLIEKANELRDQLGLPPAPPS